jgi:hypothetical protein
LGGHLFRPGYDAQGARAHGQPALQVLRTAAKTASRAYKRATGFPNDALVSYIQAAIQAAQHQAGCPSNAG